MHVSASVTLSSDLGQPRAETIADLTAEINANEARLRLPSLRLGLNRERDQRYPRRPDASWQDKIFPQVNEQRPVDVGEDVGGRSFLQHDLVRPCPVGT